MLYVTELPGGPAPEKIAEMDLGQARRAYEAAMIVCNLRAMKALEARMMELGHVTVLQCRRCSECGEYFTAKTRYALTKYSSRCMPCLLWEV